MRPARSRARTGCSSDPGAARRSTSSQAAAAAGARLPTAAGADATAKDKYGWTALHYATRQRARDAVGDDDPALAGVLMGAGCDPAAKWGDGRTSLDIAKETNTPRMAALLEAVAADPEAPLAPYRAEAAALKQLGGERGLEAGLAAVSAVTRQFQAEREA